MRAYHSAKEAAAAVARLIGEAGGSEEVAGDVLRAVLKRQDAQSVGGAGSVIEVGCEGTETRLLERGSSE